MVAYRGINAGNINIRLIAIPKLAAVAAENCTVDPHLDQGAIPIL